MTPERLVWLVLATATVVIGAVVGLGVSTVGTLVLVAVLFLVVVLASLKVTTSADSWLPWVVGGAFVAKLVGAYARYWVLVDLYDGTGDAPGYHQRALSIVGEWRDLAIPEATFGSGGTEFTTRATGLLYVPDEPTMLGGFFIFATLSLLGTLSAYAAFRRSVPEGNLPLFAAAIFFAPSLLFWPSSIGKEALMVFFIGIAAYGVAALMDDGRLRWLIVAGVGLTGAAGVRPHVAALLAGAAGLAFLLTRPTSRSFFSPSRFVVLAAVVFGVFTLTSVAAEEFDVALTGDDLDPLVETVQRNTQQGGSAVEGQLALNPADLPPALLRVYFRPLPLEAHSMTAVASALESVALLGVIIWRLPRIVRHVGLLRRRPYLLFCLIYVLGFGVVFSAVLNLGILARQRTQALPFVLALVVALGWAGRNRGDASSESVALGVGRRDM